MEIFRHEQKGMVVGTVVRRAWVSGDGESCGK